MQRNIIRINRHDETKIKYLIIYFVFNSLNIVNNFLISKLIFFELGILEQSTFHRFAINFIFY